MVKKAKKMKLNDKHQLPRESLKLISKSQPNKNEQPTYPVDRKMKFIDFDKSVEILQSRGWRSLTGTGTPNTMDTVMFKSGNIIPVEIKGRNKDNPASSTAIKSTNKNLAKKLATFVANLYSIHGKVITQFWVITSFYGSENIGANIKEQAIKMVKLCDWLDDRKKAIEIISATKIREIRSEKVKDLKIEGYNKSPRWFIDAYESETIKIKNKNSLNAKNSTNKLKKGVPVKKKVIKNENGANGNVSLKKTNSNISMESFLSYAKQQEDSQTKMIVILSRLSSEVTAMRKEFKSRELIIKVKK